MRATFITSLIELAKKNKNIFLLVGDVGFSFIEDYQKLFPDRFINTGIAEANMIGVSAGLTLSRKKVFVYSITPFVTMRCFEQIRLDLCEQNLDVVLVGVGSGVDYSYAGPTHQSLEDITLMRCLPNMTIVCPADKVELELIMGQVQKIRGPLYIRLHKEKGTQLYKDKPNLTIGKGIIKEYGQDATLITTGSSLSLGMKIHGLLKEKNISLRVISMHTVKPLDEELILKCCEETQNVYTLEEHSLIGGLGGAIAEVIASSGIKVNFRRFALPDRFQKIAGSKNYLLTKNKLGEEIITSMIIKDLNLKD